jgi:hypothetical protein
VYPIKPPVIAEKAETQEIEEPYRGGNGYALRLPFTRLALVVGKWTATYSESMGLTRAINGRIMRQTEVDWDHIRYGADIDDI